MTISFDGFDFVMYAAIYARTYTKKLLISSSYRIREYSLYFGFFYTTTTTRTTWTGKASQTLSYNVVKQGSLPDKVLRIAYEKECFRVDNH